MDVSTVVASPIFPGRPLSHQMVKDLIHAKMSLERGWSVVAERQDKVGVLEVYRYGFLLATLNGVLVVDIMLSGRCGEIHVVRDINWSQTF